MSIESVVTGVKIKEPAKAKYVRSRIWHLPALMPIMLLLILVSPGAGSRVNQAAEASQDVRPNIVFILTDDMRKDDLAYMPKTKRLIQDQGTTFENAFVTYSLCCPARATFLRGQYAHNHRVLTNAPSAHGAETWFRKMGRDQSTVATWLDDAGYRTGHVGKYMNAYKDEYIPPGWDEWHTLSGAYHKDLKMNDNGTIRRYADKTIDNPVARKSLWFLKTSAASDRPFYLQIDTHAPHGPNDYPAKYKDRFKDVRAKRVPSYNERDMRDKPAWLRGAPRFSPAVAANIDSVRRDRLRSLQVVDEMVGNTVRTLRESGKLRNTYIVFTSDNGYQFGEHRIPLGKWKPYEESIRVPLVVRGPGVPAGKRRSEMVLNNDFAPTFADLGGAKIPEFVDGTSFAPLLRGETPPWRKRFLVESWHTNLPSSPPTYQALRTENMLYSEYRAGGKVVGRELYGLRTDPYQLTSHHRTKNRKLVRRLDGQLSRLVQCSGRKECQKAEGW